MAITIARREGEEGEIIRLRKNGRGCRLPYGRCVPAREGGLVLGVFGEGRQWRVKWEDPERKKG